MDGRPTSNVQEPSLAAVVSALGPLRSCELTKENAYQYEGLIDGPLALQASFCIAKMTKSEIKTRTGDVRETTPHSALHCS